MKRIFIFMTVLALTLAALAAPVSVSASDYLFCATRAVRISDTEIVVEFTKAVADDAFESPWTSMRWMQMDASGKPYTLAWDGEKPLQNGKTEWEFWSATDHTRIILTFASKAILDAYEETDGNANYDKGYRPFLVIEEKNPGAGHDHNTLQGVYAADGTLLRSTTRPSGDNWDSVCLVVEKDYDYTPSSGKSVSKFAGLVVHPAEENITTLSGKPTHKVSFMFKDKAGTGGTWCWGIALVPKDADGNFVRSMYIDDYTWYNFDNHEKVIDNGTEKQMDWPDAVWSTAENGDVMMTVLFQIPEADLAAAGYTSILDAAEQGGLVGYIGEYDFHWLNTGYMDCHPECGIFRANAAFKDGREAVIVKAVDEEEYNNPSAPSTLDASAALASVAVSAVLGGAALIVCKKRK